MKHYLHFYLGIVYFEFPGNRITVPLTSQWLGLINPANKPLAWPDQSRKQANGLA
jgi:hypothetical protein